MDDDAEASLVLNADQASCIAIMQKMLDAADFEFAVLVAVTKKGTAVHVEPSMEKEELAAILRFFATSLDGRNTDPSRVEH